MTRCLIKFNDASAESTLSLLGPYYSSTTSYCFTKLIPACIAFTRVVTLLYQGSTNVDHGTSDTQTFTVWYHAWYNKPELWG